MNTFIVFAGLLAAACGSPIPDQVLLAAPVATPLAAPLAPTTLIRAPAHDSASIEHHRLGGNFAYATAEAHAYAEVSPVHSTITHPVSKTVTVHEPAPIANVIPGKVYTTKEVAQPIIEHQAILRQEPIVQAKTIVRQPVYKTRTYTQTHVAPVATQTHHVVAAPAAVQAGPIGYNAGPIGYNAGPIGYNAGHYGYGAPLALNGAPLIHAGQGLAHY